MENIIMLSDSDICKAIGNRLKQIRLRQNLSQQRVAEEALISLSSVKKIEKGEISSFSSFLRLLRILGQLDMLTPLLAEDTMTPNEYYEFVNTLKRKQRKRASSPRNNN
jgi:transcriptional regulator with XRE-family HTH domain